MGSDMSVPAKTEGKVNGRPVTFIYRQDEAGNDILIWQEHGRCSFSCQVDYTGCYEEFNRLTGCSENDTKGSIAAADLIAALPVHAQVPDDYSVLYVTSNPAAQDDKQASPVLFKTLMATNLPPAFINAYQPSGNACSARSTRRRYIHSDARG